MFLSLRLILTALFATSASAAGPFAGADAFIFGRVTTMGNTPRRMQIGMTLFF